jgi:hypothetical protein
MCTRTVTNSYCELLYMTVTITATNTIAVPTLLPPGACVLE